jgi:hypothetical protein
MAANSIALNASGVALNPATTGFFVNPIRDATGTTFYPVSYNGTTKEVFSNVGDLTIGGNTIINGTILSVGNNLVQNLSATTNNTAQNGTTILTAAQVLGGIIYESSISNNTITQLPTATELFNAGLKLNVFYSLNVYKAGNKSHKIAVGTGGTLLGSSDSGSGNPFITKIILTSSTAYNLYC